MGNRAIFLVLAWVVSVVACNEFIDAGDNCVRPDGGAEATDGGGGCGAGGAPAGP